MVAEVGTDVVEKLWEIAESEPGIEFTVDLHHRTVEAADNVFGFEIDDYTRHRLLEGLDDIGLTLQHADDDRGLRGHASVLPAPPSRPMPPSRPQGDQASLA